MKRPIAQTLSPPPEPSPETRPPRAFAPVVVEDLPPKVESFSETEAAASDLVLPLPRRTRWLPRLIWGAGGLLVSLALGLWAENLLRDLFARYEVLGWAGLAALALFVLGLVALAGRETFALRRLRSLDRLRQKAGAVLLSDSHDDGRAVLGELAAIYVNRPDLARARDQLSRTSRDMFDGAEIVRLSERTLMAPLDARAKSLIVASARRVALVTAVSPRALVDIAFVAYESIRLGGAIAALYGARPGFFGFLRLTGAVLGHLAVTGGLAAGDGMLEQLVGQGLAARISTRLGEGIVNGLMTVRVGIAAMRVVRPLPFEAQPQPLVRDFLPELASLVRGQPQP